MSVYIRDVASVSEPAGPHALSGFSIRHEPRYPPV
jgi:hypothetical protein